MLELTNKKNFKILKTHPESISQAVILAAGLGSRLAKTSSDIKPLKLVGSKSLITRNIESLYDAGIKEVIIITGYHAEQLQNQLTIETKHLPIKLTFAFNPEYKKSNGISVLTAQKYINSNFILMMADHIFEPQLLNAAASLNPPANATILCVDYKLNQIFDMDDATKVLTDGTNILNIGKNITHYNAIDTGLFVCSPALFNALQYARINSTNDDCSLSQGIAALISQKKIFVHDIKNAIWQDVDDDAMLQQAQILVTTYPFIQHQKAVNA